MIVVSFCQLFFFFFKQKTAYEMRISDWSSDVCSSDLRDKPAPKPEDSVDIKDSNSASRWRRARTRAEKSMAYGRRTRAHIAADRNMEHAPGKALERLSRSEVGSGAAEPAQHGRSVSGAGGRYGG